MLLRGQQRSAPEQGAVLLSGGRVPCRVGTVNPVRRFHSSGAAMLSSCFLGLFHFSVAIRGYSCFTVWSRCLWGQLWWEQQSSTPTCAVLHTQVCRLPHSLAVLHPQPCCPPWHRCAVLHPQVCHPPRTGVQSSTHRRWLPTRLSTACGQVPSSIPSLSPVESPRPPRLCF